MAIAVSITMPAIAAGPPGCNAITKGSLDVELPAGQRSSRMVKLRAGETVHFLVHSGASGATVNLVSGTGAPRMLLNSGNGGMTSFTAAAAETYVFAIEAGRDSLTSVSVNCTRPGTEASSEAPLSVPPQPSAAPRPEADSEGTARRSAFSTGFAEIAAVAGRMAASPIYQWCEELTATQAVDTELAEIADGAEAALAININIGSGAIATVLARIDRIGAPSAANNAPENANWSANLAPDLSFDPRPAVQSAARSRRAESKIASADAATLVAPDAIQGWWVTYLQQHRSEPDAPADGSARPEMVAASAFPQPMGLGALLPIEMTSASAAAR